MFGSHFDFVSLPMDLLLCLMPLTTVVTYHGDLSWGSQFLGNSQVDQAPHGGVGSRRIHLPEVPKTPRPASYTPGESFSSIQEGKQRPPGQAGWLVGVLTRKKGSCGVFCVSAFIAVATWICTASKKILQKYIFPSTFPIHWRFVPLESSKGASRLRNFPHWFSADPQHQSKPPPSGTHPLGPGDPPLRDPPPWGPPHDQPRTKVSKTHYFGREDDVKAAGAIFVG